jgi:hypothetical protein
MFKEGRCTVIGALLEDPPTLQIALALGSTCDSGTPSRVAAS